MTRLWNLLTGIPAFMVALLWMMVLIAFGTVAQARMPLGVAQHTYFETPVFWLGGLLPTPGLPLVLAFMSFSLLVQLASKPLSPAKMGSWLAHAGVLLLILSGLAALSGDYGYVVALEGTPTRLWQAEGLTETSPPGTWPAKGLLPFTITVDKFHYAFHPGTNLPAYFASDVTVIPQAGLPWQATIRMNEPLRTEGYTIYQASYLLDDKGGPPTSILAVVHDRTRLLPYLATAVLALGLLLQAARRWKLLALLPLLIMSHTVMAADMSDWATLPVQHQGRVKPLATVAVTSVPFVLGRSASHDDAVNTLVRWLQDPAELLYRTPLALPKPSTQQALGLPPAGTYSLMQLAAALAPLEGTIRQLEDLPPANRAAPQQDLLQVAERTDTALSLARTLILFHPLPAISPALAKALDLPATQPSAADLLHRREALLKLTEAIPTKRKPTALQQETLALATELRDVRPDIPNTLLRVIPPASPGGEWLSPWMALQNPTALTLDQQQVLSHWQALARDVNSPRNIELIKMTTDAYAPHLRLQIEDAWLRYSPLTLALVPLVLALAALYAAPRAVMPLALAGWALVGVGILARVVILARPPVATLYESVLFVAWGSLTLALLLRRRHAATLPAGLASAALLVAISHGLTQGNDTMGMLTAVLNTNFWLATHVLTITSGYAGSLLVGGVGLWAMAQRVRRSTPAQRQKTLNWLRLLAIWAMGLTAVGTLLGGIWAGQSWGRFWGWDPKENGALLLTLWLILAAHARMMKPQPVALFVAICASTPVVVALAWFGVNLLGVGLHSYGFTTGLATYLALFCALWCSAVIGLAIFNRYGNAV